MSSRRARFVHSKGTFGRKLSLSDLRIVPQIGETTGNYGLDPDKDELEELEGMENFSATFRPEDDRILRTSSPLPSLPPPRPEEFQYELEIAEEFQYVKPVLAAVMKREYEPALPRSDDFMRGGGARKRVLDQVPLPGSLSARDKEEVAYLIRSWARRRERRQELGMDVEYPRELLYPSQSDPPQRRRGRRPKAREPVGILSFLFYTELLMCSQNEDEDVGPLTPASGHSMGDVEVRSPR